MSIMDTLITDRTQADADAMNEKGTYTAIDMNRVGDAMEYLHNLFESYGYSMPNYKRIKLQRLGHYETQTITKPILPNGYTQLEYIKATGSQFINTGIAPSSEVSVEIGMIPDTGAMSENAIFGSTWSASGFFLMFYKNKIRFHSKGAVVDISSFNTTLENKIVCTQSGISVNGTNYSISGTGTDSLDNIVLWSVSNEGGYSANRGKDSKTYCRIKVGNSVVREYVPCKRNSDSAVGMYDLVTNAFFENAGTGEFVAGQENIEYETITEEVLVPDERDPYTWFQDDIPTPSIMEQYLTNLSELRSLFVQSATTPPVPPDMEWFTFQEANDIEKILVDIEDMVRRIEAAYLFSGDVFAGEV